MPCARCELFTMKPFVHKSMTFLQPKYVIVPGVFLILGVAINILVSWACAFWMPVWNFESARGIFTDEYGNWGVIRYSCWGAQSFLSSRFTTDVPFRKGVVGTDPRSLVPRWSGFNEPSARLSRGEIDSEDRWVEARGWPAYSMWYEADSSTYAFVGDPIPVRGGYQVSRWPPGKLGHISLPRAIPLRLLPLGFCISTAFYAIILWIICSARVFLKSYWRKKHGLCQSCAYPVGTNPLCTECGKPVAAGQAIGNGQ